jgi:hypothetical protein
MRKWERCNLAGAQIQFEYTKLEKKYEKEECQTDSF